MGFGEQAYAMMMRDTIAAIVRDEVARLRPPSRYGTVVDFDRQSSKCRVIPAGEFEPITVRMGPTFGASEAGDVVRIEGGSGNLYIAEITSGELYRRLEYVRMQFAMQGGGAISWDGTTFGWSSRFIAIGASRTYELPIGYFNIEQPAPGQVINVFGSSSPTTVAVAAGGVPMPAYGSLYYEHPAGGDEQSIDSNFRMVDFSGNFEVPANWVLVATTANSATDPGCPSLRLGTGTEIDHWRTPTLSGSWVNYGAPYDAAGYQMLPGRWCVLQGLVKLGSNGVANPIFTLPAGYRPSATKLFSCLVNVINETTGAASAGTAHTHPVPMNDLPARVEVDTAGRVYLNDTLASNGYLSLDSIGFRAEA